MIEKESRCIFFARIVSLPKGRRTAGLRDVARRIYQTSTPGSVEISPQEQRVSERGETGFIESRLASFTEGMLSAVLLQRPRNKKYSRQIGTTLENVDKSAVNSPTFGVIDKLLARLEVPLYIQNVIFSYLYTRKITHTIGGGNQVNSIATRIIPL